MDVILYRYYSYADPNFLSKSLLFIFLEGGGGGRGLEELQFPLDLQFKKETTKMYKPS